MFKQKKKDPKRNFKLVKSLVPSLNLLNKSQDYKKYASLVPEYLASSYSTSFPVGERVSNIVPEIKRKLYGFLERNERNPRFSRHRSFVHRLDMFLFWKKLVLYSSFCGCLYTIYHSRF